MKTILCNIVKAVVTFCWKYSLSTKSLLSEASKILLIGEYTVAHFYPFAVYVPMYWFWQGTNQWCECTEWIISYPRVNEISRQPFLQGCSLLKCFRLILFFHLFNSFNNRLINTHKKLNKGNLGSHIIRVGQL